MYILYIMYLFSSLLNGILWKSSFKYFNVKDLNCEYINFVKYRVTNWPTQLDDYLNLNWKILSIHVRIFLFSVIRHNLLLSDNRRLFVCPSPPLPLVWCLIITKASTYSDCSRADLCTFHQTQFELEMSDELSLSSSAPARQSWPYIPDYAGAVWG